MARRHLDALAALEALCFSQPWTLEGLREELSCPTAAFFAAELDGETAGYAGMHCAAGACYMDNLAVFPRFRRGGVGRALMGALIARAKTENADFLSLEVRPSNAAAAALYRSLGFREAGRRKNFYRDPPEDALILTLSFGPPCGAEETGGRAARNGFAIRPKPPAGTPRSKKNIRKPGPAQP